MDNLRDLIIDYQHGIFTVLAIAGALNGWIQSVFSKKMYEQRLLKTDNPADRLATFNVALYFSLIIFVLPGAIGISFLGWKIYAEGIASSSPLMPIICLCFGWFVCWHLLFKFGWHIVVLIPTIREQKKILYTAKGGECLGIADYDAAMQYFLKGCNIHSYLPGFMTAETWIAYMFYYGKGVKKDSKEALKWLQKAYKNDMGDYSALELLAILYMEGDVVEEDLSKVRALYERAAKMGSETAKKYLARHTPVDDSESEADESDEVDEDDAEDYDDEEEIDEEESTDNEYNSEDEHEVEDEDAEEGDGEYEGEDENDENVDDDDDTDPMEELNAMIGLESVKREVAELKDFLELQKARQEHGLKATSITNHLVFTGNPGTGKTTVARIVARLYHQMGIIKSNKCVEAERSKLVAEYIGQTAIKTNELINTALDGVLFIDEAYTLAGGDENDFGHEAVATLLKRMEDGRDRLVVIVAGYTDEMRQFIDLNPGLKSRFTRTIEFPDYTADELAEIFFKKAEDDEYVCTPKIKEAVVDAMNTIVANKGKDFGNGRVARNFFEEAQRKLAKRIAAENGRSKNGNTRIRLTRFTVGDIKSALQIIELSLRNEADKKGA